MCRATNIAYFFAVQRNLNNEAKYRLLYYAKKFSVNTAKYIDASN